MTKEELTAQKTAYGAAYRAAVRAVGGNTAFRKCCGEYPIYKTDGGFSIVYCKKCSRMAKSKKAAGVRHLWSYLLQHNLKKREKTVTEKRQDEFRKHIMQMSKEKTETDKIMEAFKQKDRELYLQSQEAI